MSDDNVISFEAWKAKYHPQLVEAEPEAAARYIASVPKPAHFVREHRTAAGFSQQQLAMRMGVAQTWVNSVERGHSRLTLDHAMKLCAVLGVSFDELLSAPQSPRV